MSRAQAQAQPALGVTYAPRLSRADANWDWSGSAVELDRRVRALNPWPGVQARIGSRTVKLLEGHVVAEATPPSAQPGERVGRVDSAVVVTCGEGAYAVERLQLPGGRPVEGTVLSP